MSRFYCPRCGADASVLLNLVGCITATCRNYDSEWAKTWQANNSPRFSHNILIGTNHRFLGRHEENTSSNPPSKMTFDLHCYKSPAGDFVCLARFGNNDSECYYVDSKETEVGILSSGPTTICPKHVMLALKECLKRFRRK